MNIIRTLVWVTLTAILVALVAMNGAKAPINFWLNSNWEPAGFNWPVGMIGLVFFLLGFVPLWLVHRAKRWRLTRKINTLENSLANVSGLPAQPSSTLVTPEVK